MFLINKNVLLFSVLCIVNTAGVYAEQLNTLSQELENLKKQNDILQQFEMNLKNTSPAINDNTLNGIEKEIDILDKKEEQDKRCIKTPNISIKGNTIFSNSDLENIILPYKSSCNSLTRLQKLSKQISAKYVGAGYITSLAYIKPQNIADGSVVITIKEGKIQSVADKDLYMRSAFWGLTGDILNLRDIEIGIENMNALQSQSAVLDLKPGKEVGYSIVDIKGQQKFPLSGNVSVNNQGSEKGSGKYNISSSITYDNVIGINDSLTVGGNTTDKHKQTTFSKGHNIRYSFPIRRVITTLSYNHTKNQSDIKTSINEYMTRGRSDTYDFSMLYKVFHNKKHKVTFTAGVNHYETINFFNDIITGIQTYNLSKARAEIGYNFTQGTQTLGSTVTFTKGMNLKDYLNPTLQNQYFQKYSGTLSYGNSIGKTRFNSNLTWQHSIYKNLLGANQISAGGVSSVRGYKAEGLSGSIGAYVRNDISYAIPVAEVNITFGAGLDFGAIRKQDDSKGGVIIGTGASIKFNAYGANLDISLSTPLRKTDTIKHENFFGITLGYRF